MKKIAALVTTLVLGTSGLALADNGFRKPYRPSPPIVQQPVRAWQTLASTQLGRGGRAVIDVSSKQRFSTLKLDSRGALFVDKVLITYGNGERQTVTIDRNLAGRNAATIDLEGRARSIDKIVVIGRGARFAQVSVQAI